MLEEVKAHALALNNDVQQAAQCFTSREPFNFSARHRVDVKEVCSWS